MIEPTALESSTELSSVLLQTDGGGSLSLEIIAVIAVVATVAIAVAWMLWGGSGE